MGRGGKKCVFLHQSLGAVRKEYWVSGKCFPCNKKNDRYLVDSSV